jgi:L-2-hydroxycarboxylate dehydrogenase (NAD+)
MRINIQELKDLCVSVLSQKGLSSFDAELVFNEYLDAELRGKKSHGFQSFADFAAKKAGSSGEPKIIKETGCYLHIDGQKSFGQVVCHKYVPKAISKAKENGICMMGITNMHSYQMPGTYARMAAESDIVALIFNYGGHPRIAPTGSIDPIFGTDPIAIGIPAEDMPVVVDMATSKINMMNVRMAKKLNKELPVGCCIDKDGNPTTDPEEAMDGALLPFGDYKGSALALSIEILTKTMFGIDEKDKSKPGRGFFFIFINPAVFQEIEKFKKDVTGLVDKIKNSRKAEGVEEILIPGEHSEKIKESNLKKDYIELDEKIVEEIKSLE